MPRPSYNRKFKRPYRKRRVAGRSLALKAYKMARSVSHRELKNVDSSYGATNLTNSPANAVMKYLAPVAQGTASDERIGRAIRARSINLKFQLQYSAGGNSLQTVTWMLYLHHDTDGAPPSTSQMFTDTAQQFPLFNKDNPKYGRVLKSGICHLDAYHAVRQVSVFKRLAYIATCDGVTDGIADTTRNSLYLVLWGDQAAANYPVMNHADFRFTYTDA